MHRMHHANSFLALVTVATVLNAASGQGPAPDVVACGRQRLAYASSEMISQQLRPLYCAYRTLDSRLRLAELSMIVEIRRHPNVQDGAPEEVLVRYVIKPSKVVPINVGDLLEIPLEGNEGQKPFALVFCAFDPRRRRGITEIQWIGKDEVSYYSKLAGFTADEDRVWFLLEAEASGNRSVSDDARAELEALHPADIRRAAGNRVRDFVLKRLATPALGSSQRHFYLMLLGHTGKSEDVNLLSQYIFLNRDGDSSHVWIATDSYLRLGDPDAKKRFVEHFFTEPLPPTSSEEERNAQAERLLRPYLAMLEVAPELESQAKVGEYLIRNSVLADLVLSNALAEGEQRFATLAIETYNRKDVEPLVRRESVIYTAGLLEFGKASVDRKRIEEFLTLVKNREPKLYTQAMEVLERRRPFLQWTQ